MKCDYCKNVATYDCGVQKNDGTLTPHWSCERHLTIVRHQQEIEVGLEMLRSRSSDLGKTYNSNA